ncbi:Panacea domain-containing protein [Limosilactobacillus coleohominis]|uniref:Panacea domain-containing protein n=1 Tax=Limosilactobacillus coleohominis TaxID=181675 RepID=UPI0026EFC29D|nr:type II toxin-antitoxin system antitoxin SocA domain-containing protein [Limosilactobacillus coleohominis]
MYNVFEIVNWLRVKNNADMRQNPNIEELTQMKAMKLLYYIQAASLSITNKRMFDNDIVAWKYGPVVEAVHEKYKGYRGIVGEITDEDLRDYSKLQSDATASSILNSIYDVYGYSSAYDLMRQTHKEKPWKETPQSEVISDESIKSFYSGVFVSDED